MVNALYIHIPFCSTICSYCDFPKRDIKSCNVNDYLKAIKKELYFYINKIDNNIETIYVGGGTPSSLSAKQLELLLSDITNIVNMSNVVEFSMEANPESLDLDKISILKKYGVNRVSLGVQTFQRDLLKLLNRRHTNLEVFKVIKDLKDNGINNINIDLMFAIPNQTIDMLKDDLEQVISLGVKHISYYSLILEEKSILYKNKQKYNFCDEDTEALMYELVIDTLITNNYCHYEISNFCKENYESRHNKVYWQNKQYIGVGMGAHGYLFNKRYQNSGLVSEYINLINKNDKGIIYEDNLSTNDKISEEFILGLRLIDGISVDKVNKKYNTDIFDIYSDEIKYSLENGLVNLENNRIKLTRKGLLLGNVVFSLFV